LASLGSSCLKHCINKAPYVDSSLLEDPHPMMLAACCHSCGGNTEIFPEKLYCILLEAEQDGQQRIISFFPHGHAFGIHKPKEFTEKII
jgi:hypothetical protein